MAVNNQQLAPPYSEYLKRLNLADLHVHHIDRKFGGGTWREGDPFKSVYDENGNPILIGRKRKFRYENRGSEEHAGWFLDEYSLLASHVEKASKDHYDFPLVICQLRKKETID
ncbi:hypothetical protein ACFX11_030038 [Malus domestica]